MRLHVSSVAAALFFALFFWPRGALAVDASNVLVLYNLASPDGIQVADYYAQVHPGVHLLGLSGVSTSPDITADDYLSTIRPQVLSALTPSTDVIVTTTGLPLRVTVSEPEPSAVWPNLPTYVDPYGTTRSILNWKPVSSLESELTSIDTVASWQMMGDQSYAFAGHFTSNPYYQSSASFSHAAFGDRLTARLDGFSVSDTEAAINRAQNAFVGPNNSPNGPMHFLVDNDPTKNYAPTMANLVNNVLTPAGLPTTYDNTTAFVGTTTGPVLGYVSHGANQASTPPDYISSGLNITLANGALFDTWESYNASSFVLGGNHGNQGLVGDWLAKGGTAGVGNVDEPGASPSNVTNEDKMFSMMLSGKTFAEAAWSATRQLSYVNTVVGDPLMTWKQLLPGDANRDGKVDIGDLSILGAHWNATMQSGGYGWTLGDVNSDGKVDIGDLSILAAHWGAVSSWATTSVNTEGLAAANLAGALQTFIIPEPSALGLFSLGGLSLACLGLLRKRRSRRQG